MEMMWNVTRSSIFSVLLLFTACSHVAPKPAGPIADGAIDSPLPVEEDRGFNSSGLTNRISQSDVLGVQIDPVTFDYPVVLNTAVEKWIEYFTRKGRPHFATYLRRAEHFIPYIVPILRQHGVPEDLVYLAMIESGFHNHAHSRARAVGPWQFMAATARRYGLKVDWWLDERRDIEKSTLAAIRYLKDLYGMFGSWELAAAAYNAGETRILGAVARYKTRNYWTLVRQHFLKSETRNYVPKLIAAAIISKNRKNFGFPEKYEDALEASVLPEEGAIVPAVADAQTTEPTPLPGDVATAESDTPEAEAPEGDAPSDSEDEHGDDVEAILRQYDEEYKDEGGFPARLAGDEDDDAMEKQFERDERLIQVAAVPTPQVSRTGELKSDKLVTFEIKGPADLLYIAKAASLPYTTIKSLNPAIRRWCTPPGQKSYFIRLPESAKSSFLVTYNHPSYPREIAFRKHKIRKGDSLQKIARHHGVSSEPLIDLNGITDRTPLREGEVVLLPMPQDTSRSPSALDLIDTPRRRRPVRRARRVDRAAYSPYLKINAIQRAQARNRKFSAQD